jgi:hypothetical protein
MRWCKMKNRHIYGVLLCIAITLVLPLVQAAPADQSTITLSGKEYRITGTTPCNGSVNDKWENEAGKGDVRFRLDWDRSVDLDLHVIPPKGEEVWYGNKKPPSGGELDIDNGVYCDTYVPGKPENIYWPEGKAPRGEYKVHVVYYKECTDKGPVSFTVRRWVDNILAETKSGTLNAVDDTAEVFAFTY